MKIRLALAAAAASAALLGAPVAQAAPANNGAAAKAALDSIQPQPNDAAGVIDGIAAANAVLKQLGITPFTPTIGACTDFSFPLALGGAMPGPNTPFLGDFELLGVDLNAVKKGEILYGFVPVGVINDSGDKSGMRVAWFNVNTFKGELGAPMGGITDVIVDAVEKRISEAGLPEIITGPAVAPLKAALNVLPSNGVRGGLVDTGSGTVLSAIYGTVKKGDATCFFFPSLGIATAK
ncbi:hypothetical protein L5G32_11635 [Gordonia sp. HY002]|uniref:hypothetical protein n=1 Tax=Gordonia zhenghanii TaxID=2911516 RepID=UPI001EF0B564|nr:hypothetical protein [Gordonia zhenghanii]MCF8570917.1 hypothetical protein [Gordonia zhenghanii]MCF8607906.1 hypothetical protein [Gordonia zhenghanii]